MFQASLGYTVRPFNLLFCFELVSETETCFCVVLSVLEFHFKQAWSLTYDTQVYAIMPSKQNTFFSRNLEIAAIFFFCYKSLLTVKKLKKDDW